MKLSTANLQTSTRRASLLSRHSPYWVSIGQRGKCIGYRRAQDREPGTWYAKLYVEGRWVQSRLGVTDDRDEADGTRVLTLLQAKEKALTWFPTALSETEGKVERRGHYKVADALTDYFEECLRRGMKPGNLYRQRCSARAYIEKELGHVPVERLTIGRIKRWMGNAAARPARKRTRKGEDIRYRSAPQTEDEHRARRDTVNRVLSVLKAALNLAVTDRLVPVASAYAWREVKPFRMAGRARNLFLSAAQQRSLIAACEGDFGELARAGLYCGARYGELRHLLARDLDAANGSLHIAAHIAKNGKPRHIHLDVEGKQFFTALAARLHPDEPLFLRNVRTQPTSKTVLRTHPRQWGPSEQARPMRQACLRAKFNPFPFYTLRHSCAARWLQAGVPMAYVAEQLGHSVAICQQHYGHLATDHVAQVMRSMPPLGLATVNSRLRRVK